MCDHLPFLFIYLSAKKAKWSWWAVLLLLLPLFLALLLLAGYLACKKRPVPPLEEQAPAEEGHGNVRTYKDEGAGEEDNYNYDLKHLMTFMYLEGGQSSLVHEHAGIRNYAEEGVGEVDTQHYDIGQLIKYRCGDLRCLIVKGLRANDIGKG